MIVNQTEITQETTDLDNNNQSSEKRLAMRLRHWLSNFLVSLTKGLNAIDRKVTGYYENPNVGAYEDLGPTNKATNNVIYETPFLWALKKLNITNIAITGPYGSGKSSIIATFQEKHKQFRYLNISLATFDQEFKKNEDWRQKVELSILQQLIYHEKNKNLPDSRFKKISHTSKIERFFVTAGLILLGICFFYIYKPDFIAKFSWWKPLDQKTKDIITYITLGIFLLGVSLLIYHLYRTLKSFRFSKLGLTSGEIKLADKEDKSIFNKHLDEIIYFFQVTKYDVIVIEDLDRFNDAEIFTKLREVNNLINNSRQVGRRIKFVYAVRDDMFKDKDRAKFFDFIIPVIPIINTSNAGDKLAQKLKSLSLQKTISDKLLNTIALYIQDMRLLINIINEFKIYLGQIGKNLDPEKLFAIIIYKNIYPEEFAKLHNQDGDVFEIIKLKRPYIAEEVQKLDQEIDRLQKQIDLLKAIKLKDVKELRSVYLTAIVEKLPNFSTIRLGTIDRSMSDLLKDNYFNELIIMSQISYRYQSGYSYENGILNKTFKDLEKEVDPDYSYMQRLQQIEEGITQQISTFRGHITRINREKTDIHGLTIAEIINRNDGLKLPDNLSQKSLLTFLITEGFIDEHYPTYISFFIEGSLTQADMDFVMSVAQKKPLEFGHELKNIETIVTKWLAINNYGQKAILNISFVDWLITEGQMQAEINKLLDQLVNNTETSKSFIHRYLENGVEKDTFIRLLCERWIEFWDFIFDDSTLDDSILDKYLLLILKNVPPTTMARINASGQLSKYINLKNEFLSLVYPLGIGSKIKQVLNSLDIKFNKIEYLESLKDVFEYIYQHNHYIISLDNIQSLVENYPSLFENITKEDLLNKNFTVINESKATHLFEYVNSNMDKYVLDVLLATQTNVHESVETIEALLNHEELTDENKRKIIFSQTTKILELGGIPTEFYGDLFKYNKVVSSWKTVYDFYCTLTDVNDELINYLNISNNLDGLNQKDWQEIIEEDESKGEEENKALSLEESLLMANRLNIEAFEIIVNQSTQAYIQLDISGLSVEKVTFLVNSSIFDLTIDNFKAVNREYPALIVPFVLKREDDFLNMDPPPLLTERQYIDIIGLTTIPGNKKIKILQLMTIEFIRNKPQLGDVFGKFLLNIGDEYKLFSKELLKEVIKNQSGFVQKVELLTKFDDLLTVTDVIDIVSQLPKPYSELLQKTNKPLYIKKTSINEALLNYLNTKLSEIISSVTPYKDNQLRVNFKK